MQEKPRRLDRIAGNDDVARALSAPLAVAVIDDAAREAIGSGLDLADHGQVADFRACRDRTRNPGVECALLRVGRTAALAEAAIDAWRRLTARRRHGR